MKQKKQYELCIKSHTGVEDYEDVTEAHNIDEAVNNFLNQMPDESAGNWDKEILKNYIGEYD